MNHKKKKSINQKKKMFSIPSNFETLPKSDLKKQQKLNQTNSKLHSSNAIQALPLLDPHCPNKILSLYSESNKIYHTQLF